MGIKQLYVYFNGQPQGIVHEMTWLLQKKKPEDNFF